jgi:hypothetical protein
LVWNNAGIFHTGSPVLHVAVRTVSDCVYTTSISAPKQVRQAYLDDKVIFVSVDFSKIYSIKYDYAPSSGAQRLIAGLPKAACEYKMEANDPTQVFQAHCTSRTEQNFPSIAKIIMSPSDPKRVDEAIRYFKNVCPMNGF